MSDLQGHGITIDILDFIHLLDILQSTDSKGTMVSIMGKRTTSVTVKMSEQDFELMNKAAETIWPGAPMTKSSIILGLARMGAEAVLKGAKRK
jgi:hypothetical protein